MSFLRLGIMVYLVLSTVLKLNQYLFFLWFRFGDGVGVNTS